MNFGTFDQFEHSGGRVRVNEANVVNNILGHGNFPLNILTPLHEQLEGQALNVHVAFYRIVLGLELVAQWDEFITGNPIPNATLVGGASAAQNSRQGRNPPNTQQGHYVQASVNGVPFGNLPQELQRLFGHTMYVPTEHNQGIHRSIDNAQESLINQYNQNVQFDANLAIAYCNEVLSRIDEDRTNGSFQYDRCDPQDVDDYVFTVTIMRNSFQQRMANAQTNGWDIGRAFILDPNNFKPLEPAPEDY